MLSLPCKVAISAVPPRPGSVVWIFELENIPKEVQDLSRLGILSTECIKKKDYLKEEIFHGGKSSHTEKAVVGEFIKLFLETAGEEWCVLFPIIFCPTAFPKVHLNTSL